jgi:hypothetical protein
VVPGEDAAAWETHRAAIVQDLAPVGALEEALADRIALGLWRLRRVAAYEAAAAADALARKQDKVRRDTAEGTMGVMARHQKDWDKSDEVLLADAEQELEKERRGVDDNAAVVDFLQALPGLPEDARPSRKEMAEWIFEECRAEPASEDEDGEDPEPLYSETAAFLSAVGVPPEVQDAAYGEEWSGNWTAGMIRAGLVLLAKVLKTTPDALRERVLTVMVADRDEAAAKVPSLAATVKDLRRRVKVREERRVSLARLPDETALDKVLRYEAHAGRQLTTALHALERLQAARAGKNVTPPAVLDVTIEGGNTLPALASGV